VLKKIDEGLWDVSSPVRFLGLGMKTRTTVVQLAGGGLLVHSPGALSHELRTALDGLGNVVGIIAPNRFHHLWVNDWREAFPDAECHVSPGLPSRRKDLADAPLLTDAAAPLWSPDMDQEVLGGLPALGEVIFLHRPTRTLIGTDFVQNMHEDPSAIARTMWRMAGNWKQFGPSRLERLLCRDRTALKASLETILSWDFDRVVMAHGEILNAGGKDGLANGYRWAFK